MTILQSLARRYDWLAAAGAAPVPGFAPAQIGFTFVLTPTGEVSTVTDERSGDKSNRPRLVEAPQAPSERRGEKIVPGTYWDPADYAIGVPRPLSSTEKARRPKEQAEKLNRKATEKFAAFKKRHQKLLAGTNDEGCRALLRFLEWWTPDKLGDLPHADEIPGQNIAFRLSGERGFIHDRKAARELLISEMSSRGAPEGVCLVTGAVAPIARLHAPIKGVGEKLAPLVSFNEDAFTSYGKLQGANAPVSEAAAFAYTTALNALLTASGITAKRAPIYRNRVMLGETTVAFWAEHGDAEAIMRAVLNAEEEVVPDDGSLPTDETTETDKLRGVLERMQQGFPLQNTGPEMHADSRVYVLGLSPNAARLSVRFWVEQSLGDFTRHFQQHWNDLRLDPPPRSWPPPLWRLLLELAAQRKSENIPPQLGGELMRSVLTGNQYPVSLLVQVLMRIRAEQSVTPLRAALVKAVLARRGRRAAEERRRQDPNTPAWRDSLVSLDRNEANIGYRLGRLFALIDYAQWLSVGQVNAGMKDKFFASASATPGHVFPGILRTTQYHLSDARKSEKHRSANWVDAEIKQVMDGLPAQQPFPATLSLEDQGRFIVGFYHQRGGGQKSAANGEAAPSDNDQD